MKNLLLLHGALSTQKQFDNFKTLLENNYHIHTLTFRGYGNNNTLLSGNYFEDYAEDILHYMLQNQLTKVCFLGYSMGGYAALYFAHKYPEMVESIMTLNTKFDWNKEQVGKEIALLNAAKIEEKVPAYAQSLMQLHGKNSWKTVLASTKTMMEQLADEPLLNSTTLANIKQPVLIGVGDRDNTATVAENLHVQQQLPNAAFWVLPNTPHPFDKVNFEILTLFCKNFFK
jgi:pimeloyl-ACP methyl ester carboxylesterase